MIYAAFHLFCEFGIDNVSLASVAKAAGVSPNSILRYFDSKASLVFSTQILLWEEIVAHLLENSRDQLSTVQNGLEEIEILLKSFQQLYENHSKYVLFFNDYKSYLVRNGLRMPQDLHERIMRPIYVTFMKALSRGQTDGSITTNQTVEAQFFTIWGLMRGFVGEIVTYDFMYDGVNPWKGQFPIVLQMMITALKNA